jgi:outer membrane autotransporter protein
MKVKIDDSDSLNMRLGLTAGRSFNRPDGQNVGNLYVKAGVNHDFLGKTKIRMNEFDFKTRSLGTRFYFGVGGELVIGNQWKAFAQIGGEHGNRLNVDLSCKAGIKYSF